MHTYRQSSFIDTSGLLEEPISELSISNLEFRLDPDRSRIVFSNGIVHDYWSPSGMDIGDQIRNNQLAILALPTFADIDSLNAKISVLETTTGTHTTEIGDLQQLTNTHTTEISSLQQLTSTHTSEISALQQLTAENSNQITGLIQTQALQDVLIGDLETQLSDIYTVGLETSGFISTNAIKAYSNPSVLFESDITLESGKKIYFDTTLIPNIFLQAGGGAMKFYSNNNLHTTWMLDRTLTYHPLELSDRLIINSGTNSADLGYDGSNLITSVAGADIREDTTSEITHLVPTTVKDLSLYYATPTDSVVEQVQTFDNFWGLIIGGVANIYANQTSTRFRQPIYANTIQAYQIGRVDMDSFTQFKAGARFRTSGTSDLYFDVTLPTTPQEIRFNTSLDTTFVFRNGITGSASGIQVYAGRSNMESMLIRASSNSTVLTSSPGKLLVKDSVGARGDVDAADVEVDSLAIRRSDGEVFTQTHGADGFEIESPYGVMYDLPNMPPMTDPTVRIFYVEDNDIYIAGQYSWAYRTLDSNGQETTTTVTTPSGTLTVKHATVYGSINQYDLYPSGMLLEPVSGVTTFNTQHGQVTFDFGTQTKLWMTSRIGDQVTIPYTGSITPVLKFINAAPGNGFTFVINEQLPTVATMLGYSLGNWIRLVLRR